MQIARVVESKTQVNLVGIHKWSVGPLCIFIPSLNREMYTRVTAVAVLVNLLSTLK